MKALILGVMEIFICSIILYGWYFKCLIKKEPLLETFDGAEDIVLKLLAGGILIYLCVAAVIPAIQDIPNIIQKNIYTIEGIAQKDCKPPKLNRMSVPVVDEETQEVVYVTFFYGDPIDEGDRLTVQYLPNLKFGVLIEKNGERIRNKME